MTSGMRRPPRLWEQKLEGMIRAAGVSGIGVPSSSVISPGPTPGPDGPGSEPAPPPVVDPDPATPRVPSTPVVAGTTLGLSISWDGKDSAGVLFPVGVIVEVHVSASTGFTPSSGTLKGTITEAGGSLLVGGIAAGSTFYVKFVAVYPDGQKSDPSAQGSAMVGLVQGPEINGDAVITQIVAATTPVTTYKLGSIWLNTSNGTYNVLESVGGTPTWVKREWDSAAIAANAITANQIAAQAIASKFLTGEIIRTGSSPSARIEISATNGIEVFRDATTRTFWAKPTGEVIFGTASVSAGGTTVINGDSITTGTINVARLNVTPLTATDVGSGGTTTIDGGRITTGSVNGDRITGGTITGTKIVTSAGGSRIRLVDNLSTPLSSSLDGLEFLEGSVSRAAMQADSFGLVVFTDQAAFLQRNSLSLYSDLVAGEARLDNVETVSNKIQFQGYRTTTSAGDTMLRLNSDVSSTNEAKFRVDADGDVLSRTNSYAGFSDARYKENVEGARDYLDDLREVEVVTFNWQGSDQKLLGVTAQQIQPIFPSMVAEDEDGTLSVRYSVFVPMLITAVQSLAAKVDDLSARLEAVEG